MRVLGIALSLFALSYAQAARADDAAYRELVRSLRQRIDTETAVKRLEYLDGSSGSVTIELEPAEPISVERQLSDSWARSIGDAFVRQEREYKLKKELYRARTGR